MKLTTALLTLSLLSLQPSSAKAPDSLTWKNFDQVSDYIRLKPGDLNYQKITWLSTVIEGQQQAHKQDKPLLLWLYFGDPRANC